MSRKEKSSSGLKGQTPASTLALTEFLCFSIYSANHAFNRVYQPLLKSLHLTYPQFIAMVLLWEKDGQSVGELGKRLFLQSNTLTPMLKRLEVIGYITRKRDAADERQVVIWLTDSGRKLQARAVDVVGGVRQLTELQDQQFNDLKGRVDILRTALERQP